MQDNCGCADCARATVQHTFEEPISLLGLLALVRSTSHFSQNTQPLTARCRYRTGKLGFSVVKQHVHTIKCIHISALRQLKKKNARARHVGLKLHGEDAKRKVLSSSTLAFG